ncbi:MAG: ABC transporter ATP-binding protein [Pseudomonadota bacterium]
MAAAPRLDVIGLTRRFGTKAVVDNLTLRVAAGEVMCLLGPSGCGKSTVLRCIAGVDRPNQGQIRVDGQTLSGDGIEQPPEAREVGLMFQDFALFPHMSVAENVAFGLTGGRAAKADRVRRLLDRVHMARFTDAYPHQLSGGEQQRVALARALAPRPKVMLMDEPFSGLDDRLRDDIRDDTLEVLQEEGTAVLMVTHEPEEAMRMADAIALMRAGRIVQMGTPRALYTAPVDRAAAAFFSDVNSVPGRVRHGIAETPLGQFPAPELADGTAVEAVFRPQHARLDFDRSDAPPETTATEGKPLRVSVRRARFLGVESLIELQSNEVAAPLKALVQGVFLPKPGTMFWLTIRRDRCTIFPAPEAPPTG